MGIIDWGKKKAKQAKKKAEEAARKAKEKAAREARKAAEAAERKAREAREYAEHKAREAQRAFEDTLKKTTDPIERLALKAERAIKEGAKEVDVRDMIQDELNKLKGTIKREVINEVKDGVVKPVEEAVKKEFDEFVGALAKAVTKEGLKTVRKIVKTADEKISALGDKYPALAGEINNLGFSIEIGPVTLAYSNFYDRVDNIAEVLDTYVNHPPEFRREPIIKMITALGPTTIDLGASIQVVALVVGSKELGIGGSLDSVGIGLFTELGDAILAELGVPE